ncbi:hypothetical protein YDYSG_07100 [Paenibacillus tyrfis]|nr:hypothetical protein YDYSG_07100 [Paenibacillus tyrfis]
MPELYGCKKEGGGRQLLPNIIVSIQELSQNNGGVMKNNPKYVTKSARDFLIEKLGLPEPDEFCQDWEYIVANASRIEEFLAFYENTLLNIEGKFALMVIIIASFNDYLNEKNFSPLIWNRIKNFLEKDDKTHMNTILYWSLGDEDLENCFAVTRYMREIKVRD